MTVPAMIPRVYVAGPYTAPTKAGRLLNVARARMVARDVCKLGGYPVCPHLSGIELEDIQDDWQWWMQVTSRDLSTCGAMVIVPGWKQSKGTREEIHQSRREGRPMFFAEAEREWDLLRDWIAAYQRGTERELV